MKKLLLILFVLAISLVAYGDDVVPGSYAQVDRNGLVIKSVVTVTADGSGNVAQTALRDVTPSNIGGYRIREVEIECADDDAFQVLIYSNAGSTLLDYTTTSASTGEIASPDYYYIIHSTPEIDVVGLTATKVATITILFTAP